MTLLIEAGPIRLVLLGGDRPARQIVAGGVGVSLADADRVAEVARRPALTTASPTAASPVGMRQALRAGA